MKLSKIIPFLIIPVLLMSVSCKKSFFTDVNKNPNALDSVKPNLLLPTVEAATAYTINGDISRYTSLIMQQVIGNASQSEQYYQYNFNAGVFENVWSDIYTSALENNYVLIQSSDAGGYNAYAGIARILMAYTLQVTVDLWGDIPYSEAFQGNAETQNIHPKFDDDAALYDTIGKLVDDGIAKLGLDPGLISPGADDVMYGGDAAKWIKFGHAIKARLAIHQSKDDAAMASTALTEIGQSFESNADNAVYIFGNEETSANSWYQFYRDRPGDIKFETGTLAAQLKTAGDPRYDKYDLDADTASYFNKINSPAEFITYDELQFMKAEALLRSGGSGAQIAYVAAITADFDKLGISGSALTTYLAANGTLPSGDAGIAKVADEEYKALFLNPEAFTLYRRTGQPNITAIGSGGVPRRLLYPQSELSFNAENVPQSTLYTPKIFWDK
ncbi:MAG: SusD/RagB family nutrient-binding outer membrane lipoprotein [Chitinophagaceae bacterium]|nr:SusD/RagB family nutrient-binding outer membrane lipoprotein [Chitinophagaceae bacterium]